MAEPCRRRCSEKRVAECVEPFVADCTSLYRIVHEGTDLRRRDAHVQAGIERMPSGHDQHDRRHDQRIGRSGGVHVRTHHRVQTSRHTKERRRHQRTDRSANRVRGHVIERRGPLDGEELKHFDSAAECCTKAGNQDDRDDLRRALSAVPPERRHRQRTEWHEEDDVLHHVGDRGTATSRRGEHTGLRAREVFERL